MSRPLLRTYRAPFAATALVTVSGTLLTGCQPHDAVGNDSSAPLHYVALGDSFASMSSMAALDASDAVTEYCMRSADNFASLVANDLHAQLSDATCQGAVVSDVLEAHEVDAGIVSAQVDNVDADTGLVTVTIGANDVAFGMPSDCDPEDAECYALVREENDEALAELPGKLDEVYTAIAKRAPHAAIITTGYLPILYSSDSCAYAEQLSQDELEWFDETTLKLNDVVERAATAHNATFVMPEDSAAHTGCASVKNRWTSFDGAGTDSFAMHPTPAGQQAMAAAIRSAYEGLNDEATVQSPA